MKYIRDLGGIKTLDGKTLKKGYLYRSSALTEISQSDETHLKSLGLKRVFDLRNVDEANNYPDYILEGCRYINVPLIDSNLTGVTHEEKDKQIVMLTKMPTIQKTYEEFITSEYGSNKLKDCLRQIVLEHDYPIDIHCATGKDRAGVVSFLTLMILGVSKEDCMNDYMKQFDLYKWYARKIYFLALVVSRNKALAKKAYDYFAIDEEMMEIVLSAIDNRFGSFDLFVSDFLKLSNKDIKAFKDELLV